MKIKNEDLQFYILKESIDELFSIIEDNNINNPFEISKTVLEIFIKNKFYIEAKLQISIEDIKEIVGELIIDHAYSSQFSIDFNYPNYTPKRINIAIAQISWFKRIANTEYQFSRWISNDAFKKFKSTIESFLNNLNKIEVKREFIEDGAILKLTTNDEINKFQNEVIRIKNEQAKITEELNKKGYEIKEIKDSIAELWSLGKQIIEDINNNNISEVSKKGSKVVKLLKKFSSPLVAIGVGVTTAFIENKIT